MHERNKSTEQTETRGVRNELEEKITEKWRKKETASKCLSAVIASGLCRSMFATPVVGGTAALLKSC